MKELRVINCALVLGIYFTTGWSDYNIEKGQWLRFGMSNDVVFQTDQYYTNGLYLEYVTDKKIPFFSPLHFIHNPDALSFDALSFKQDIFTPENLGSSNFNDLNRPFASYLILGSRRTSIDHPAKLIFTSEFEIGILGKYAGGELIQNGVHSILPASSHVQGWENQVKSDLMFNYGVEIEKGLFDNKWFGLSGHAAGKVGMPNTFAGTGLTFRLGEYDDYFRNLGLYPGRGWQVYFFTNMDANLFVYNATIQGGILNPPSNTYQPQLNPFVFKLNSGLNIAYKNYNIEIGAQHISPEFKNGRSHRWGYVSFTFNLD